MFYASFSFQRSGTAGRIPHPASRSRLVDFSLRLPYTPTCASTPLRSLVRHCYSSSSATDLLPPCQLHGSHIALAYALSNSWTEKGLSWKRGASFPQIARCSLWFASWAGVHRLFSGVSGSVVVPSGNPPLTYNPCILLRRFAIVAFGTG